MPRFGRSFPMPRIVPPSNVPGVAYTKTLTASVTEGASISGTKTKILNASETMTASRQTSSNRTLVAVETTNPVLTKTDTRILSAGETVVPLVQKAMGRALIAGETEAASIVSGKAYFKTLSTSEVLATSLQKNQGKILTIFTAGSPGPNLPSSGVNDPAIGTFAWSNPGNIIADDGNFATAVSGAVTTEYLKGTGFGFSIPANATINGIILQVKQATNFGSATENSVKLVKAGTVVGTDRSTGATIPVTTPVYVSYGGPTDLWGAAWTPSDINNANFGAAFSGIIASFGGIEVDAFKITVFYSVVGGITEAATITLLKSRNDMFTIAISELPVLVGASRHFLNSSEAMAPSLIKTLLRTLVVPETIAISVNKANVRILTGGMTEAASLTKLPSKTKILTTSETISSVTLKPQYTKVLVAAESETGLLTIVAAKHRVLTLGETMTLNLTKNAPGHLPLIVVTESAIVKHTPVRTFVLSVTESATLSRFHAFRLILVTTAISEHVVSMKGIPTKFLVATVHEIATINKGGHYPQPPAVLHLYGLDPKYPLPLLVGSTVSFMSGVLGDNAGFDIYGAYVLAGGPFYICDNGLKDVLDKNSSVIRVN